MQVKRTLRRVLVCVSFSILPVCATCGGPPPLDRSLLTGEPCEPPCWQGLTPGESTEEDVAEFIRASGFVNRSTVSRGSYTRLTLGGEEVSGVIIDWHSTAGGYGSRNIFAIEGGVLKDITINPDYPLTLGRLIDRYGPPEKYVAGMPISGPLHYDVILFYPTHGFTVDLVLPCEGGGPQPQSKVAEVWYFRAAPLERFLELSHEAGHGGPPGKSLEVLRDWPGYGRIELH